MIRALLYIAIPIAGMLAYNTFTKGRLLAEQFKVKVLGIEIPKFGQGTVSVPVKIEMSNSVNISLSITDFKADLFVFKDNQWLRAGNTESVPNFTIPAKAKEQLTIGVFANIKNLLPTAYQIITKIQGGNIYKLRADISGKVEGVPVSFSELINV